jgi:hypothetical protein
MSRQPVTSVVVLTILLRCAKQFVALAERALKGEPVA